MQEAKEAKRIIVDTLETLEEGDTIKLRLSREGSDYKYVEEYEIVDSYDRDKSLPMSNGDYKLRSSENGEIERLFIDDDGVSLSTNYSPSDLYAEAIAVGDEPLYEPEWDLRVERDGEGNVVKSEAVQTDSISASR